MIDWDDAQLFRYKATIERVLDGDTIHVMVDLGMKQYVYKEVRMVGFEGAYVDAPETRLYRGVTEEEKKMGLEVKAKAEQLMPVGSEIRVISHRDKSGKYGRMLATVYLPLSDDEDRQWYSYVDYMVSIGYDMGLEK